MPDQEVDAALASLVAVKNEHREILRQISNDPGMSPETRTSLIEHLYAEEDEHLAEIQLLRGNASATPSPHASSANTPGLTVGSLRADPEPIQPNADSNLSVGSLRH
ncbi:MAG: hypothetical protein JKY65_07375 [Planctomycetes bacterium]|nr:hypothetical protein [Planctomycetota bacterium]